MIYCAWQGLIVSQAKPIPSCLFLPGRPQARMTEDRQMTGCSTLVSCFVRLWQLMVVVLRIAGIVVCWLTMENQHILGDNSIPPIRCVCVKVPVCRGPSRWHQVVPGVAQYLDGGLQHLDRKEFHLKGTTLGAVYELLLLKCVCVCVFPATGTCVYNVDYGKIWSQTSGFKMSKSPKWNTGCEQNRVNWAGLGAFSGYFLHGSTIYTPWNHRGRGRHGTEWHDGTFPLYKQVVFPLPRSFQWVWFSKFIRMTRPNEQWATH